MTVTLERCDATWRDALVALFHHPAIYPAFSGRGSAEDILAWPHTDPAGTWVALAGGEPVGFAISVFVPEGRPRFTFVLLGVHPSHRRQGVGRALLAAAATLYRGRVDILRMGFGLPSETAPAFAAAHGFSPVRRFWGMERPLAPVPAPDWPVGVSTRVFDGSDEMLRDFHHVAQESFAESWGAVRFDLETMRREIAQPSFRAHGLGLAYRDDAVAGFCQCTLHGARGEIDTLGVLKPARGMGLGRALLRWGTAWLQSQPVEQVTLLVDGENESALRLYRSEGFAVASERVVWEAACPP